MSTDLHTLSGAYALHALSPEEASEFQKHLAACDACQQEVRELEAAAARMGASEAIAPPPELKSRVLSAADRMPQLPPKVSGVDESRRRSPWLPRLLAAAAAAVLVVTGGILAAQVGDDEGQAQLAQGVVRVFQADDAHTATVETSNGGRLSVATSPGLNEMAVDTDELPPLDEDHVYQLWAIVDGSTAPVLVLEPEKGAFMEMPSADTEVAITIEPAGGSQQPTTDPIVQVTPSQV
jgi:anti-sigma-K factor RskA